MGTLWSNCWVLCERTQKVLSQNTLWVHCGHFVKEQSEFVQKVPTGYCAGHFVKVPTTYLLGMSRANWWALFENNQYVPAGYFAGQISGYFSKVPTIYLLGLGWVNGWVLFESAHHVPTGYIALRPQCLRALILRALPSSGGKASWRSPLWTSRLPLPYSGTTSGTASETWSMGESSRNALPSFTWRRLTTSTTTSPPSRTLLLRLPRTRRLSALVSTHWGRGYMYPEDTWRLHCDFLSTLLSKKPLDTCWVILQRKLHFDHHVPRDHIVITFEKKTPLWSQCTQQSHGD